MDDEFGRRPRIGIVAKRAVIDGFTENCVHETVNRAVLAHGGLSVTVLALSAVRRPMVNNAREAILTELSADEKAYLERQLATCDGVLLQGGSFNDFYEGYAALYCHEQSIPVLGICAGAQAMTQVLGGGIVPVSNKSVHDATTDRSHDINIKPGSVLARLTGEATTWVNSRHVHWVNEPGQMTPVAWAPDGVVETLEDPTRDFYLAVQFHPETIYEENPAMAGIFKGFVAAAEKRQEARRV